MCTIGASCSCTFMGFTPSAVSGGGGADGFGNPSLTSILFFKQTAPLSCRRIGGGAEWTS